MELLVLDVQNSGANSRNSARKANWEVAAFILVILIVLFWSVVGLALASALYTRRNLLQTALLSPAAGASATALLVTTLNLVVPVRYGGPAATLLLAALSVWLLRRYPAVVPVRRLLPFAVVLLLSAAATGFAMFRFGFNWISYGNDDMANYCLGGKFFLNHAQLAMPSAADIVSDRDASLFYWFFYVLAGIRHGAEEVLAWVLSMTGLSALEAFMPVILAFHVVLIAACGALVLTRKKFRRTALLACFAMGLSSLITLGTLYQLFGQVTGLGALAAACAVWLRPPGERKSELAFAGLLAAGTAVFYPEVLPFLGISYILYHAIAIIHKKEAFVTVVRSARTAAVFSALFLNFSLVATGVTLILQARGLTASVGADILFPYYLTPAGFAYFWGFQPIGNLPFDIAIVAGAILFLIAFVSTLTLAWRGEAVAVIAAVMFALCLQLFRTRADFGLFKIAMYIQPFLLGTLALGWARLYNRAPNSTFRRVACVLLLLVVLGSGTRAQRFYIKRSLAEETGPLAEIPYASREGLISELRNLPHLEGPVISDTSNVVLGKIESAYGSRIYFSAQDFLGHVLGLWTATWSPFRLIYENQAQALLAQRGSRFVAEFFDMHGALPSTNEFLLRREISTDNHPILQSGSRMVMTNRRTEDARFKELVRLTNAADQKNFLMFVGSQFGSSYYAIKKNRSAGRVSMYQIEPDFFFHGKHMAALGRDSLFRVLNPSSSARLVLEYTATLNGDGENRIPAASAIGEERQMFEVEGRGSGRFFSPPLQTQDIEGGHYVALDMGSWGRTFPEHRSRIARLYGDDIPLDSRRIVGFVRDISLVSDIEYASLSAPQAIQLFPADLDNKDLEYTGIYEDGWVAESSYAVLQQPESSATLVVELKVPMSQGRAVASWAAVLVDGREVARQSAASGSVLFKIPVPGSGKRRVGLRFERAVPLPVPDGRPASARIRYVGFQPPDSGTVQPPSHPLGGGSETLSSPAVMGAPPDIVPPNSGIGFADGWYDFERFNGQTFRWSRSQAVVHLTPGPGQRWLIADLEPNSAGRPVLVRARTRDGRPIFEKRLAGREEIRVPLSGARQLDVVFQVDKGVLAHSPHDKRQLSLRFFHLRLE